MKLLNNQFQLTATDLSNHLGCEHLTQLNRKEILLEIVKPDWHDPSLDVLAKRGKEHEEAYVQYLKKKGLSECELSDRNPITAIESIRKGFDVITQASLESGIWGGIADILIKVPGKSKFGDWMYEVQDTKLSQNTRAGTILQLCLYSDLLTNIQGTPPSKMSVIKPENDYQPEDFLYSDFQAYYRLIKKNLEQIISGNPPKTYPNPVEQCDICQWWKHCKTQRKADDHLSLVAGIRSLQIKELNRQGIGTLEQFAKESEPLREQPERGSFESYVLTQEQAKIQLEGRVKDKLVYKFLPVEEGRGFTRLPEPSNGDIYFDIEGDPFFSNGGIEYLLGYSFGNTTQLEYKYLWAFDRVSEKKAFEQFIDFVMARWAVNPNMYIYHYGIYEPSAIKRLVGRHDTRAEEVDKLLRGQRFIDLHSIIKESLKASVERYSLKDMELFTSYERKIELPLASVSRRALESALELNEVPALSKDIIQIVQEYNQDDCLATQALHQWLEKLRAETGQPIVRPELKTGDASEELEEDQNRARLLYKGLSEGLPDNKELCSPEEKGRWLLANMVDYFWRELKSSVWEFHRLHKISYEDALDERKAIAGLQFTGEVKKEKTRKNTLPIHQYIFPQQEVGVEVGDKLYEILGDEKKPIGTVVRISGEEGLIEIKKTKETINNHPQAVHIKDMVTPKPLAPTLQDFASDVLFHGMDRNGPDRAGKDLLLKSKPHIKDWDGGPLQLPNEKIVDAAIRIALNLQSSVLAIQGPPGSGKTYLAAMMILKLAQEGKKIGVTAVSHKVTRKLFDKVLELSKKNGIPIQLVQKPKELSDILPDNLEEVDTNEEALNALDKGKVVGGTVWLWARKDAQEKNLDYLFIEEAGQMSLSYVLAASRCAKNLILLGDPQQLEQPQRGSHPEGADVAALTHWLDGSKTMPDDRGLFLGVTRRLHPDITSFTSELFYEGRLKSFEGLDNQVIGGNTPFDGAGLFYVPIEHMGCSNMSIDEVNVISRIVKSLLNSGTWTNEENEVSRLTVKDVLIVAPYNAQVDALKHRLPNIEIGTVDKFQGQEAPIVIYSMTSSSHEDAPRGMSFLYNLNRLNVATSRARSLCILVASPRILRPECKSIEQMRWANAICRYYELAREVVL